MDTLILANAMLFLSTLSLRRATQTNTGSNESGEFLSTLSLRRATNIEEVKITIFDISIHALLAESDNRVTAAACRVTDFYPRSPCGERPAR